MLFINNPISLFMNGGKKEIVWPDQYKLKKSTLENVLLKRSKFWKLLLIFLTPKIVKKSPNMVVYKHNNIDVYKQQKLSVCKR